ncbi:unnamed protein product [Cercopithifilaria johnstoni]|uniref:Uncharacterized protein n=1 Tax=Cercopithifilaria johnstoni TaxID=2874296 RepID=A0A8J2Q720_9BILA|nr:unnamed protein product [Cercopithifilaria johnstoni]
MVIADELRQKSSKNKAIVIDETKKQQSNLKAAKSNRSVVYGIEETQRSQPESTQNIEEVLENEKEIFELNESQNTSSHGTLQYVQPRVRFFERAGEVKQCEPIDKQRNEYRTFALIDEDKNCMMQNIYPREVRQQDITECKIEKYNVVGYQIPEIFEEYTCRDDF